MDISAEGTNVQLKVAYYRFCTCAPQLQKHHTRAKSREPAEETHFPFQVGSKVYLK